MSVIFFKRRYADIRVALPLVSPLASASTFILIAFNFTGLEKLMSVELFAILFLSTAITSLAIIGKVFRKKQQSVDFDLGYERQKQFATTQRIMLESILKFATFNSPLQKKTITSDFVDEVVERIKYLKKIESGTI